MSQSVKNQKAYTYKVKDLPLSGGAAAVHNLYFNLLPLSYFEDSDISSFYISMGDKCFMNQDGYGILGDVIYRQTKNIEKYLFYASSVSYNKDMKISEIEPEMIMAFSYDIKGHISQHIGIQRINKEHPHKNISMKVHSFCANVTKYFLSQKEESYMTSHPLKVMREKFEAALPSKITKLDSRSWDEKEIPLINGIILKFDDVLPNILKMLHPGNSPYFSSPQIIISNEDLSLLYPIEPDEISVIDLAGNVETTTE